MSSEQVKKIGLINVIGLGIGGAVGSGIFVTLGSAIGMTGRSVLVVTLIGVFYMLFAYWYNLALSSIFVVNGGDYSMRGMMLPPVLTGYGGWTNVIWAFGCTGYSMALTNYLSSLWPVLGEHATISSMAILTIHFLLTFRGNRIVTIFQNAATAFLLIALVLFIVLGVPHVDPAFFFSPTADGGFVHGGLSGVISAIAIMGFACQGTTMGPVGVAKITKNPKRTIPLGILITCVIVAIVYGLMSYVAAGVLPYGKVANQNLSVVASAFLNPVLFAFFIIGGGACAIVSSFLGVLVMIREPLASMADDGWLTGYLSKKAKDGYPYGAFTLVYILAAIPILTGMDFNNVISMLMIPCMFINAYLNAACIKIPDKYPEQFANRSIRCPLWLYKLCCLLGGISALLVGITLLKDMAPKDAIVAIIVLVVPLALSWRSLKVGDVDRKILNERKEEITRAETQNG